METLGSGNAFGFFSASLLLISTSIFAAASDDQVQALLGCLVNNSEASNPITSAVYTPENSSFSDVLQAYIQNLRFNTTKTPKPLLIVAALHESHIQAAVVCTGQLGVVMKIRSGGHDYDGLSYVSNEPFFILDMFNFRSVSVDVEEETAWVQAGATLGEIYYRISEKSKSHGFPGGVCPTVGAGGHISGGGYGNMIRKYGLTVDNIVDAILVDARGRLLDRGAMGEDHFWAIRGGGGASFGVIVSFKIKLVRVPETVTVFRIERMVNNDTTLDAIMQWQDVASHRLPHELFIRLTLDVVVPSKTVRATFRAMYLGDSKSLQEIVRNSIPSLGADESDYHEMSWVESVIFWHDSPAGTPTTALLDRRGNVRTYLKRKSDYVKQPIPRLGWKLIWKKLVDVNSPIQLAFNPYGGRMDEIQESATPFPHRAGNLFKIQYETDWTDGDSASEDYIAATRGLYEFMTPFMSTLPGAAFLNYRDIELGMSRRHDKLSHMEALSYGVRYFKGNFARLMKVKAMVYPSNVFWNEQSIPLPH